GLQHTLWHKIRIQCQYAEQQAEECIVDAGEFSKHNTYSRQHDDDEQFDRVVLHQTEPHRSNILLIIKGAFHRLFAGSHETPSAFFHEGSRQRHTYDTFESLDQKRNDNTYCPPD